MSRENLALIRRCYEMWNRDDMSALPELLADDFVMDMTGRIFNPDIYRGRDEFARFRSDVAEVWEDFHMEILELFDSGDRVLAHLRQRGQGLGSGVEIDSEIFQLWTVREGRAVHMTAYTHEDEAFRAAGLESPDEARPN